MLEDDYTDVCNKAMRGLSLDPMQLLGTAQVSASEMISFLDGHFDTDLAFSIAKPLQIDGEALARLPDYIPFAMLPNGVEQIVTPFGHLGVNSWLISYENTNILFDAGNEASLLLEKIGERKIDAVFITHEHADHLIGLEDIRKTGAKVYGAPKSTISPDEPIGHDSQITIGNLTITALDGSGHCIDSLMYLVEGLDRPLCIVGDTVFAGSIGGCNTTGNYDTALRNIKHNLVFRIDIDTILLPGHGPATTLGSETRSNPFLAAMLR